MNTSLALKQLKEIEKRANDIRLAADGWKEDWQTLIATLMSARTTDKVTIPVAQRLFNKYSSIGKLSKAKIKDIENTVRPVNFYKTKSKHIVELAKIIVKEHGSKIPHDFNKLTKLPGVGRKTANVFLAEQGQDTIGIDVHLTYVSNYLGWSKHKDQHKIEIDLENLFPQRFWSKLNWIVVRFGQTYPNRKIRNKVLGKLKKI